jgi:hypothetical protein
MARLPPALVAGHHIGVDAGREGAPFDQFDPVEATTPQEVVFGQLPHSATELSGRQRFEGVDVTDDSGGLPERPDQVLALRQVHTGLAPDGGVDLAQQRGGDVGNRNPAVVGGGHEPGQVRDHPAADRHHTVGPGHTPRGELRRQLGDDVEPFGPFAVFDGEGPLFPPGVDLDPDPWLGHHGDAGRPFG